jgi:5-methylcytosine-specific restriction endonuclease McrA
VTDIGGKRPGTMTGLMRKAYRAQKGKCWLCGHHMPSWGSNHPLAASRDHVQARAMGGYDKWRNHRLAHRVCNSARGHMPAEVFRATVGNAALLAARQQETTHG